MNLQDVVAALEKDIAVLSDYDENPEANSMGFREKRRRLIEERLREFPDAVRKNITSEFDGWGPLTPILEQKDWSEILVNGPSSIWIERGGQLQALGEKFFSKSNYDMMMSRLCLEAGCDPNLENPSADGNWRGLRVHLTRPPISRGNMIASLRRHPENPWNLQSLLAAGWCTDRQAELLKDLVQSGRNFLVVGSTGTGKTSVINALMQEIGSERCAVLEDSDEIAVAEGPSLKLLTRKDPQGQLPDVTLTDLLRHSLRLRPDRIVVGEIRGGEAKDFLLALSTGHSGSFGTLHASTAAQALLRLEMLVQMGAPEWNLTTVRRLIHLSLQNIVVLSRDDSGKRRLVGIQRLVSLEENGFLVEPVEYF